MTVGIAVLLGVLAHLAFNRLEPRSLLAYFALLLGPPTALAAGLYSLHNVPSIDIAFSYILYLSSLILSTILYRLSPFHPLARYPGPIISKITGLWSVYIFFKGRQHIYYKHLHARYGTHVRTAPNSLQISESAAVAEVLGAKGLPKGPRYDVSRLEDDSGSLISLSDPHKHAKRRRLWDRALNVNAIQGYCDALEARIRQLVDHLGRQKGDVDLNEWITYFSFDFMGDLAFGGAFQLMEEGKDPNNYVHTLRLGVRHQEMLGLMPWAKPLEMFVPTVGDLQKLRLFAKQSVVNRKMQGSRRKDIFFHLLDEGETGVEPLSLPTLMVESSLAIVAGSDTTGTTISNLLFSIISHPKILARLQKEVDVTFPSGADVFVPHLLAEMKYLNAVINEVLRLYPVIANGVQRKVPKNRSGVVIAGRWVPSSTCLRVPTYVVHRDPRYFSPDPEEFRPERWLGEPGYHTDTSAFFPFSHGPMNCVGKNLALQNLRMVTCCLVQKFDFEFVEGWDTNEWHEKQWDIMVMVVERLPVRLRART